MTTSTTTDARATGRRVVAFDRLGFGRSGQRRKCGVQAGIVSGHGRSFMAALRPFVQCDASAARDGCGRN